MQGLGQPDISKNCLLCGLQSDYIAADISTRMWLVDCPRCGRYTISFEAVDVLPKLDAKYLLSYVCRTWAGEGPPEILTTNISALLNRAPRRSIPEKRDSVLELMAQKTDAPGHASSFDAFTDYPLLTARDANEAVWLMDSLYQEGSVSPYGARQGTVTMKGWVRVGELRQAGPNSAFTFVAMSFNSALSSLYDAAIEPAVRDAGYEPIRVDRKEHANSIDDEIIGNIRKSRFMVADFTGQRAGVYFEAGMMTGLGRTVIWMCDKSELDKVHFDVRQRNFIDWESVEDAKQRLFKRILAIEGEGPNAIDRKK